MVNTFLPYADFKQSAQCLDYRRLGKQRVEARQIIKVLEDPEAKAWKNHPATLMWKGYVPALKAYFNVIVSEWVARGYKNNLPLYDLPDEVIYPWWLGKADFHYAHQASLLRKDSSFYKGKFVLPERYVNLGYIWPKLEGEKEIMEFSPVSPSAIHGKIIRATTPSKALKAGCTRLTTRKVLCKNKEKNIGSGCCHIHSPQ